MTWVILAIAAWAILSATATLIYIIGLHDKMERAAVEHQVMAARMEAELNARTEAETRRQLSAIAEVAEAEKAKDTLDVVNTWLRKL